MEGLFWIPLINYALKFVLIILNFPLFFRLIKKLSDHAVSLQIKPIVRRKEESDEKFVETRLIFQNQQDTPIDREVRIIINMSKEQWLNDDARKAVSIVHGPMKSNSEKPNIQFLKTSNPRSEDCQITFPQGVRPLATWMIICRAKSETASLATFLVQGKPLKVQVNSKRIKERFFDFSSASFFLSEMAVIFLFLVIIAVPNFYYAGWENFIDTMVNTFDAFFISIITICLLISALFGFIAIKICTPVKPNIIMGYLDENDPKSTTHFPDGLEQPVMENL